MKVSRLYSELALYLCDCAIWPCVEYFFIFGLVLPVATWIYLISYIDGNVRLLVLHTAQKMKKSHVLKKSSMENFIFCAVTNCCFSCSIGPSSKRSQAHRQNIASSIFFFGK